MYEDEDEDEDEVADKDVVIRAKEFTMYEDEDEDEVADKDVVINGIPFNDILEAIGVLQTADLDTSSVSMSLSSAIGRFYDKRKAASNGETGPTQEKI